MQTKRYNKVHSKKKNNNVKTMLKIPIILITITR